MSEENEENKNLSKKITQADKHENFRRLGEGRVNKALNYLRLIGNLANRRNYYYTDDVQGIFENEVFGFLNNVEEYNAHGMTKRGVIIFGKPGTGKCLAKGTTVLMYDGTIKPVEEIKKLVL